MDDSYHDQDGNYVPRPPWIKLWVSKYAEFLDLDTIIDEYKGEELNKFLEGMGKVFLNLLYMYAYYGDGEESYPFFEIDDRFLKLISKQLYADLKQTFREYEKRCAINRENGKKGGRPSSNDAE